MVLTSPARFLSVDISAKLTLMKRDWTQRILSWPSPLGLATGATSTRRPRFNRPFGRFQHAVFPHDPLATGAATDLVPKLQRVKPLVALTPAPGGGLRHHCPVPSNRRSRDYHHVIRHPLREIRTQGNTVYVQFQAEDLSGELREVSLPTLWESVGDNP